MRFRLPLVVLLAGTLVWWGCEEQMAPETAEIDSPAFAKGGPPPDECDLKALPLGDYFGKAEARDISALVKDLSAACVDGLQDEVLSLGFQILSAVDSALPGATDFGAGGQIVAGVWTAVQYNGGTYFACDDCAQASVYPADVAEAMEFGAFGVRLEGDTTSIVSKGDEVWVAEPPQGYAWVDLVPLDGVLIYGYSEAGISGNLHETEKVLTNFSFNWNVAAWWATPNRTTTPILVGPCVAPEGVDAALISHVSGSSETFLPRGPTLTYCQSLLASGSSFSRLASLLVPLWPSPLNASMAVGVSGSGKAREFSPFNGFKTSPFADTEISQPEAVTTLGSSTCFVAFSDPDANDPDTWEECNFAFDWVTARDGDIGGNPTGSLETFVISAVDNNGAKTEMSFTAPPVDGTCWQGGQGDYTDFEASQLICECDGRAVAGEPCDRIELEGLTLNKTGVFSICVEDLGGAESSGLTIRACTQDFHIKPNG